MTETALLSPNGQQDTAGQGPATRLFVATIKGVVRLDRQTPAAPWTVTQETLSGNHMSALLHERNSGKLFAAGHGETGVWVSDDGTGTAWRRAATGIGNLNVYSLASRVTGNEVTIFAGAEPASLYRSDDLGETWRELAALRAMPGSEKWNFPPPPHIAHVKSMTVHPTRPETLFACVEQGALLTSTDDGKSWRELDDYSRPDDPTYRDMHRILLHPKFPAIAYLTTGVGTYRSEDGGETWRALTQRGSRLGYPDFIFLDPENPDILIVAGAEKSPKEWPGDETANSAVLKSIDGGESWRELNTGLADRPGAGIEAMSRHTWPGGTTLSYATAAGEIYSSDDGGENWTLVARGLPAVSKGVHYRAFLPGAKEKGKRAYA